MNYPMTLEQFMSQGILTETQLVRMAGDVADALSVIHQQRMIHGEIKPGNIEMRADGSFRLLTDVEARILPLGVYQTIAAPELSQGAAPNPTTDIYSLGAMMRELASHQGVNIVLSQCIDKACNPNPALRYQNARDMVEELDRIYDALVERNIIMEEPTIQAFEPSEEPTEVVVPPQASRPNMNQMPPQASRPNMNQMPPQASSPNMNQIPPQAPRPNMNQMPPQAPRPNMNQMPPQAPRPNMNQMPPQAPRPNMNQMPPQAPRPNMNQVPPQQHRPATQQVAKKKQQQSSLALSFILPIMIGLMLGSAALVYFLLIKPGSDKKKEPTTTEIVATGTSAVSTVAGDTTAQTPESAGQYVLESYVNSNIQDVQSKLEAAGLKVNVQYQTSDTVEKDLIIEQSIPAGTSVNEGQDITLTVSEGDGCPEEYHQKVTVSSNAGNTNGTLTLYNWENGGWVAQFSCGCKLGRNGINMNYGEGKGFTPEGTFKLGFVLTTFDPGNNMPYKQVTSSTCVVDDINSPLYNIICDTSQVPSGVSKDTIGNNITSGKMSGAIFIEHNGNGVDASGVTPGKGSVITICGINNSLVDTAGCIDIKSGDFSTLLRSLDGTKNPYIEIKLN